MHKNLEDMDTKELSLPDTIFVRDIESKVFQALALQCLAKIEGISLLEGSLFDSLLGREVERIKGITVEQDQKKHSVNIRVEINVFYGISIPEKAEEIQAKVVEEISRLTGLHVGSVHIIFKNLIVPHQDGPKQIIMENVEEEKTEEYAEDF